MANRYQALPQPTQDVVISNNIATVVGIEGLPIQNANTPGGVFFVDPNILAVQCLPLGGSVSGTPDNVVLTPTPFDLSNILNKLVWERSGVIVYDNQNTLVLEQ